MTLGPLLAGASLVISSYLLSLRWASGFDLLIDNVLRIFPLLLSWLAFWLLYSIVPTTRVPARDALVGSLVLRCYLSWVKKVLLYISAHTVSQHQLTHGVRR